MFLKCYNLINAPKLPAKIMCTACYKQMFATCTSLIKAPELPSTNLAEECYD